MKKRGRNNPQQSTSSVGDISRAINHRKRPESNVGSYRGVVFIVVGLLVCVGLVLWSQKEGELQHPVDQPAQSGFTDVDYEVALQKKLAAPIQPGWFQSTSSAMVRVDPVDEVHNVTTFIKELTSFSWPTMSNVRNLQHALPIFTWDLTQFALSNETEGDEEKFVLPGCRLQVEPVFVLGSERDKGGMVGSKHDHAVMYVNVSMADFLRSTFREKMYLYWTGELEYLESHFGLRSTIDNDTFSNMWESFHVEEPNLQLVDEAEGNDGGDEVENQKKDGTEDSSEHNRRRVRPMVWLSHPGVVAQTHYDTQHNIFIQVQGFKRFHLFPPATELYVYPNIHQSFRQSQIHFEQPTATNDTDDVFAAVTEDTVEAIEVTVGPGDILYIPPFWQHRVESLTLSLSLSILSPSEVEAAIAELFWLQVPFGGDLQQHRSVRIRAVIAYMESIFRYLKNDFTGESTEVADNDTSSAETATGALLCHRFAQSLYRSRFAPLLRAVKAVRNTPHLCPLRRDEVPTDDNAEKVIAQLDAEEQILRDARGNFEEAARHFVDTLQQLQTDDGIKRTFMRDYLEHLVRWAVGPQLTGEVLHRCF